MSSAKSILRDVWPLSHYDPGREVPNRIAARPTPPEKKERQETRGKEYALEVPRRCLINLFVFSKDDFS
jgi:hypothetical protein